MANLTRLFPKRLMVVAQRSVSTTSAKQADVYPISAEDKARIHPRIGDRDIVGFGHNGSAIYTDRPEYPCPAIRFGKNTPEVLGLRKKEQGDWSALSIEDKKALYRASFAKTYAEMNAPTGEWRFVLALTLGAMGLAGWIVIFLKKFVYSPLPHTITREWQEAQLQKMIDQNVGPISGVASKYDYEKGQFK